MRVDSSGSLGKGCGIAPEDVAPCSWARTCVVFKGARGVRHSWPEELESVSITTSGAERRQDHPE